MSNQDQYTEFHPFHKSGIQKGNYRIVAEQSLKDTKGRIPTTLAIQTSKTFSVAGSQLSLHPNEIKGIYPPAQSTDDYSSQFPHIQFSRSTFPWERHCSPADTDSPWLALILLQEEEHARIDEHTVALTELEHPSSSSPYFSGLPKEGWHSSGLKTEVIDIPRDLLNIVLPIQSDLKWLSHVRATKRNTGVEEVTASLFCNRLPRKDGRYFVYLISLENRFDANGQFRWEFGDQAKYRFVTLKSWQFHSVNGYSGDFFARVNALDRSPSTLRIPNVGNAAADKFLEAGSFPLPHHLRNGGQTVSWYRGPLIPFKNTVTLPLPARAADALIRYHEAEGMFDITYAAAWELGRLLSMQNTHFSRDVYAWRRKVVQEMHQAHQASSGKISHLKAGQGLREESKVPQPIVDWISQLKQFEGIPFHYLVPDEALLPTESVRFFQLDPMWMQALIDGALSPGRTSRNDQLRDAEIFAQMGFEASEVYSGFVVRSDLVADWPDMHLEGYRSWPSNGMMEPEDRLPMILRKHLPGNMMLCLFEGTLQTIDFHLKPDVLHFGMDHFSPLGKKLRLNNGETGNTPVDAPVDNNGVVHLRPFIEDIQQLYKQSVLNHAGDRTKQINWRAHPTSADLAVQLMDRVEMVRLLRG